MQKSKLSPPKRPAGFTLVEIILAVALFGLFATALIGLLINSYGSNFQAEEKEKATLYAQQGLEAVWSIRRQAWNILLNGDHGVSNTSGRWEFSGSSDLLENKYNRVITISNVCRNVSGDIVDCSPPGAVIDLHSKKAVSKVTYAAITGVNNEVELQSILTTWQTKDWLQTDWLGGQGQGNWSNPNRYWADDGNIDYSTAGEIKLINLGGGGCGVKKWPFDTPTDHTYNPADIEVTGGYAQLKEQTSSVSGGTTNPGFDSGTTGWTYVDWDQGGGEVNVTGTRSSSGGNPGGYVYINIPSGSSDELGGFWRQPFTTTVNNPTVNVNFDWRTITYNPTPITFKLYVFVDSTSGAPVRGQEVWSSPEITATSNWTSVTNIDATARVSAPGTYYLKIAVWVETPGISTGPFRIGYDNVSLTWAGGSTSYPTNNPPINPITSLTVSGIDQWSSFSEVASKNSGEIYYQLSDDDGATWYYWSGSAWSAAGSADYNTASVVNTNISSFPTTTAKIMFKAFLDSNNNEQVRLDEVKVGWGQSAGGGYAPLGWLESSSFNTGGPSAFNLLSWQEIILSLAQDIQVQLATAPDISGSPGIWSDWLGLGGVGTYYQSGEEILIPLSNGHNDNQWVKYKVILSGDGSDTPILQEIKINYLP